PAMVSPATGVSAAPGLLGADRWHLSWPAPVGLGARIAAIDPDATRVLVARASLTRSARRVSSTASGALNGCPTARRESASRPRSLPCHGIPGLAIRGSR